MGTDRTVLVGFDGSDPALAALEYALQQFGDARIVVLTIIDPTLRGGDVPRVIPASSELWYERARETADERLDSARATADERGVEIETAVEVGLPSSVIVRYAADHDVDHLVVGSHGRRGLSRVLLGSVAEAVVRRSPVPVTVIR